MAPLYDIPNPFNTKHLEKGRGALAERVTASPVPQASPAGLEPRGSCAGFSDTYPCFSLLNGGLVE